MEENVAVSIMISPECNLECPKCYYKEYTNKHKLNFKIYKKILDRLYFNLEQFDKLPELSLKFRGGEIAMYPEYIEYFIYALEFFKDKNYPNFSVNMSTNMYGQPEFYKSYSDLMKQYPELSINFSFHESGKDVENILKHYQKMIKYFNRETTMFDHINIGGYPKTREEIKQKILDIYDAEVIFSSRSDENNLFLKDETTKVDKNSHFLIVDYTGAILNTKNMTKKQSFFNFRIK